MEFGDLFSRLLNAIVAILLGIGGMAAFYYGANALIERMGDRAKQIIRPWIFAGPALLVLLGFLVYPMFNTIYLSFTDDNPRTTVEFTVPANVREDVVTEFEAQTVEGEEVSVTETEDGVTIQGVIREGRIGEFEEFLRQTFGSALAPEELNIVSSGEETATVEFAIPAQAREAAVQELETLAPEGESGAIEVTEDGDTVTISGVLNQTDIGEYEDFLVEAVGDTVAPELTVMSQENFTLDNYQWAVTDANMLESFRNNLLWLILVPTLSTALGLVIAMLADRVRWENIAKALIFMPLAISFVGASVIWRFIYYFRPEGSEQIGLLNAIVTSFGGDPVSWLTIEPWNNFALIVIMIWMQTGFAMVILSSALKGVPEETLEAARIDGAGEVRIFWNIIIPQIASTILVVITTIIILVLKVFDIPFVMTSGEHGTEVLANVMYRQMMNFRDFPRGSVAAVILMLAVIPIMIYNVRRFRQEEALR